MMDFYAVLDQVIDLLKHRGRASYRALKVQFQLDDASLEALKDELIEVHHLAQDHDGRMLVLLPLFRSAVPRPSHQETPASSAACLLSGLSRLLIAAPRLAARRFGKPPRRAGGAGRPQGLELRQGRR